VATLLDFRRRIRSVKSTQQITRAMKFVAAARLRRAQERVVAARPYAREILNVLRSAVSRLENFSHPLLVRRPELRLLAIVVSGDKGLCGAFNTNVLRKVSEFLGQHPDQKLQVIAVGRKGRDAIRRRRLEIVAELINVSANVEFRHAREIADRVTAMYAADEVDAVYIIYNEFKSVMHQNMIVEKFLPIDPETFATPPGEAPTVPVDYIYEQPPAQIFERLVPRYIQGEIYRTLLESAAAEHAARMTAMDSATNNAADLIEQITLHMNKVRQAAITKEIIEVVSGAASAG
jgi:F-type H+-transporting ATPase subunit gamma